MNCARVFLFATVFLAVIAMLGSVSRVIAKSLMRKIQRRLQREMNPVKRSMRLGLHPMRTKTAKLVQQPL